MLGYSDSCKDGGILSAAWGLYQAQQKVVQISNRHAINCRIFHGRGGTITRGGGPTHDAIMSQPKNTVQGQIKFTEQGEVLSHKYGNAETAVYELTMGITGLMKATMGTLLDKGQNHDAYCDEYHPVMQQLSDYSEACYRELTDHTEGFFEYFYETTPVSEIGLMNIGSRPSHRRKGDMSKTSVRAIPWVFGWSMSRTTMPAWYGVGYAINQWSKDNPERHQTAAPHEQALAVFCRDDQQPANVIVQVRHAHRARVQPPLRRSSNWPTAFSELLRDENKRSIDGVLQVDGSKNLLAKDSLLKLSLTRRDPYLDPLAYLQIDLLRKYRDESQSEADRMQWQAALLSSINGIAAGLRNTG